jgi:hypothetical protein
MHEPHRVFDSIENHVVVSISPPLAHPPSNFSHVFSLLSLHHVLNQMCVSFPPKIILSFPFQLLSHTIPQVTLLTSLSYLYTKY